MLIFLGAAMCLLIGTTGQEKKYGMYAVGFYNLENMFDTIHDAGKNDYEYLPTGVMKWSTMKYKAKLNNIATVLSELGTDRVQAGAAAIGVAEVENARVLTDLINQQALKARSFKFIHVEGPDRRGIDCALLYSPRFFTPEKQFLQPYIAEPTDTAFHTRGFLTVQGTLAGDKVTFIVCHWPSRAYTSHYREQAGKEVRALKDSIQQACPEMKIIIMGDMNDAPFNLSMKEALGAKRNINEIEPDEMFNPWWNTLTKEGRGTLMYNGKWNLFDQIILSPNLLNTQNAKDYSTLKYYKHEIFSRSYLFQTEGRYKGNTKRKHASGVWLNGYSDHLPVTVYLVKEL